MLGIKSIQIDQLDGGDIINSLSYLYHKQYIITILSNSHEYYQCLCSNNVRCRGWKDSDKIIDNNEVLKQFGISYDRYADYLCLKGDDKIGIPGIKKIGKIKARQLVQEYNSVENMIKENVFNEETSVKVNIMKKITQFKKDVMYIRLFFIFLLVNVIQLMIIKGKVSMIKYIKI